MRHFKAIVAVLSVLRSAGVLQAQSAPVAAVGIALPTGGYATQRSAGPVVRGGLAIGEPASEVSWRLEGEAAWLLDRHGPTATGGSSDGTLRAVAVLASFVAGPSQPRRAPYVILGAGPQWIRVQGAVNPYGTVASARAGVGYRGRGQRATWRAEVAWHVVLSDFGTGHEYTAGKYVPITVGVEF